jgi:hypothetical protein
MTKIIHIVLLGEIHRDPASAYIARKLLNSALNREQPVIFADENVASSTVESKLIGNQNFIEFNSKLIKSLGLEPLLSTDLFRPYFKYSCYDYLVERLSSICSGDSIENIAQGLIKHAVWSERVSLWKFLKEKNIVNYSFDANEACLAAVAKSRFEFFNQEKNRIKLMASNIIKATETHLPDGGIVIVQGGVNHTPNLLAAIKAYWRDKKQPGVELIIQAFRLFSPYVSDGLIQHNQCIIDLREALSGEINAFYSTEATPIEEVSENSQDGSFNSRILDELGNEFYSTYQISNMNAQKREQINQLFGRIVNQNPDGYAIVEIHSAYLVASIRQILGIERYQVSFSSQTKERLDYLKSHCSKITIESKPNNKFLITFPQSIDTKEHLTLIANDKKWQEYLVSTAPIDTQTSLQI